MHAKPLGRIAGELLHRRPGGRRSGDPVGPDAFGLDAEKVGGFTAGTLDGPAETRFAEEVALVLPLSWSLTPRAEERLSEVGRHLGGRRQLLEWLDRHPGLPRLTARLFALMDNLDHFSERPAVIEAVGALRDRGAPPAELRDVLPPETTEETLADVAQRIEELLGRQEAPEAARVALATAGWLRGAGDAAPGSPEAAEMSEVMSRLRTDIAEAADVP